MEDQSLEEITGALSQPLEVDNPVAIMHQLAEAEAWQGIVSVRYRVAEEELAKAKNKFLLPKSKEWTDMDRTVQLEAKVAEIQRKSDLLRDLQEQIQRRISLGQTLIRAYRAEVESSVRAV